MQSMVLWILSAVPIHCNIYNYKRIYIHNHNMAKCIYINIDNCRMLPNAVQQHARWLEGCL